MTFISHTIAYSFAKKVRQLSKGKDGSRGGKGGKGEGEGSRRGEHTGTVLLCYSLCVILVTKMSRLI